MNSSIHLQRLVKWTVPAVAFVIALFWYKRHRIDRAEDQCNDPGGVAKLSHKEETILSDSKKIDTSLHDSSTNYHCTQQEEPSHVPRKTSESMDTSIKNYTSQSSCHNSYMYTDFETTSSMNVELGNNSSASYFEMIVSSQNGISFDSCNNADYVPVYKDVADEKKETVQCETEPYQQECAADKYSYGEDKKQAEKNTEDTAKTEGEAEERDSANHSPLSGALEGSVTDEARSEGSTDSGKGGSINGCKKEIITLSTYDFAIPQHLVGRLIGRHGSFLHNIRTKAGVDIYVNDHPCDDDYKICSIQGSVETIQVALKIIRQKFPEKKFPQMTLEDISTVESVVKAEVNENVTFDIPCTSSLSLCECVNNDINICHIVKPNWLFVQLTTHPTHHLLQNLEEDMTYWYNNVQMQPELMSSGIEPKGTFVAVHWDEKWVRGCIEIVDPLGEANIVRLVDHGGYWKFPNEKMKPIRVDCLQLPFQAIEIFLANVQPKDGVWSQEAYNLVYAICNSSGIALAQIAGRIDNNVYTNIYFRIVNYGVISLADELIANGHANHVPMEQIQPETIEAICT